MSSCDSCGRPGLRVRRLADSSPLNLAESYQPWDDPVPPFCPAAERYLESIRTMDPNEALHTLIQAAERIQASVDDCVPIDDEDATQAADAAQALDGWLRKGGFLPDAWKR